MHPGATAQIEEKATTVVLADDHHLVRQGLRSVLEAAQDIRVVGEAGDGLEAVRAVERLRPRVLVVDRMMPGLSGLEVTRQVSRRFPATRIVVLSMYADEQYVLEALRNGATAYVLKASQAADLFEAIRRAAAGLRFLSLQLHDLSIEAYAQAAQVAPLDPYETLSDREREVLQLAAEGHSNTHIAERLFISPRTVEVHRGHMMRKLNLHTQTDLIRYALRRGLLSE